MAEPNLTNIDSAADAIDGLFADAGIPEEGIDDQAPVEQVEEPQSEVIEEPEKEIEAEASEESDVEESDPEDETEELELDNLSQVAEALELPAEELDNLKVTVKVDGETVEVNLGEAKAGYQRQSDYSRKTEALRRERDQFQGQAQDALLKLERDTAATLEVLQQLENWYSQPDPRLEQLRQTDPQEWTAQMYARNEGLQQYQRLRQQTYARLDEQARQIQAAQLQARKERLTEQARLVSEKIPSWSSELKNKLTDFLAMEYGFSPEELSQADDHRQIQMAYESMLYREGKRNTEATTKKVRKAPPKTAKPAGGNQRSGARVKRDNMRKLKNRLRESGKTADAGALIEQLL